jgi:Phosphatidylinositolglycan class N (PIG-N)
VYAVRWRNSYSSGLTDGSRSFCPGLEPHVQTHFSDTGKLQSPVLDVFPVVMLSTMFQSLLTALSILVTWASMRSLQLKLGLPLLNQVAGWIIFGALNLIHMHFFWNVTFA